MAIYGIPPSSEPPRFQLSDFIIWVPELKEWASNKNNSKAFKKFIDIAKNRLNYGYWGYEWENAVSLCIAHYICLTAAEFKQNTTASSASGAPITSRSVSGISYGLDVDKTMVDDDASSKFWNQTGYGRQLLALSRARGYVPIIVVT